MGKSVRLENWSVIGDAYQAPECRSLHLHGACYGHPRKEDGKIVKTSRIVGKRGQLVKTHSGTLYELGEVNAEYEAMFPNARQRLLEQIGVVKRKRHQSTKQLDSAT